MSLTPEEIKEIREYYSEWNKYDRVIPILDEVERLQRENVELKEAIVPDLLHKRINNIVDRHKKLRVKLFTYKEALEVAEKTLAEMLRCLPLSLDLSAHEVAGCVTDGRKALTQVRKVLGKE